MYRDPSIIVTHRYPAPAVVPATAQRPILQCSHLLLHPPPPSPILPPTPPHRRQDLTSGPILSNGILFRLKKISRYPVRYPIRKLSDKSMVHSALPRLVQGNDINIFKKYLKLVNEIYLNKNIFRCTSNNGQRLHLCASAMGNPHFLTVASHGGAESAPSAAPTREVNMDPRGCLSSRRSHAGQPQMPGLFQSLPTPLSHP